MSIKTKLAGLGLIGILFAVVIGASSYLGGQNMAGAIAGNQTSLRVLRNQMQSDMMHDALRADVLAALHASARKQQDKEKEVVSANEEHIASFREAQDENKMLPLDNTIISAIDKARPVMDAYMAESRAIVALAFKNVDEAEARLPKFTAAFQLLEKELQTLSTLIEEDVKRTSASADAAWALFKKVMLAVGVIAVLLEILALHLIVRNLIRQLGGEPAYATDVAAHIAKGDLSIDVAVKPGDTTSLLAAMATMQDSFKTFVAAQQHMASQHEAGAIGEKIAAGQFPGVYGQMAQSINDLAASHVGVTMKVVEVVKRYSVGDLSVDMDRLPGEQAQISQAVDGVKASLQSINGEIGKLVAAAAGGDFTVRGDADNYQNDFRKMVEGLNRLMQVSDSGLREVSRVLAALARGDLTERNLTEYQGAFGQLKNDSNTTIENLTGIVSRLRDATESINTAAKEIASGNSNLSQRTEEQASSLEETASSMEELTSTVKQNAENARQANQLAIGASGVAIKGGTVVGQVVATMRSIDASSKKIADIISVIDGIAFQTNILALNAAVEAARAGEQGRGFAVVATEVRNLAQRSAAAAKEIKELICDSVEKVGAGTRLVDDAGKTMEEIVTSVKRVTDIMAEITAASLEQSSGIEQVNQAITQMDEVTQQNAALVEQAAAAAESMEEQAQVLARTVGLFRLAGAASAAASPPPERRDLASRPANVARLPKRDNPAAKPAARAKAGSADDWAEF